ncbi:MULTISPECIES: fimbrial protein [Achromobacter]|uniref:fimbrial protein n=1 Tax=Achromobacter TaxID=222 RepID=UPI0007C73C6D|nr:MULTISPECIES: fimbrial protein [Achromobacter]MDQ6212019.1 type 1 fimbrial protein [Achromobacter insolitus]MEB3095770.1 fimbrial protein [Achromobacter sp. D10]NGT14193.1 type 1 fimbrial protein [Achromobacter insolitus]OAE64402.1 fimbrial protein [Achromobacter insolitus]OCZ60234.1 fimbrial protein [Achromobacter insolitus]
MNKLSVAAVALSALVFSAGAFAADPPAPVKGGEGKITFSGVINNDACSVDGTDSDRVIAVDMGSVSIKDMGTAESPASGRVTGKQFNLNVNCNQGTKVTMVFDPAAGGGSGIVTGKGVLALDPGSDAAKNVGIALIDGNGAKIDLSTKTTSLIQSDMRGGAAGGDATLRFSAAYVTTGAAGSATAGRGDATLPFILQYQ